MELAYMPRNVFPDIRYKSGKFIELSGRVILSGDYQCRYLYPYTHFLHMPYRFKHRLKSGLTEFLIKTIAETFQVDIRRVEIRADSIQSFFCHESVGHKIVIKPFFFGDFR